MSDTSPKIDEKMREMIRMKAPTERFKMGCSMYETSKTLVIRSLREGDPNISEAELRRKLFLSFYGDDFNPIERDKIIRHFSTCRSNS